MERDGDRLCPDCAVEDVLIAVGLHDASRAASPGHDAPAGWPHPSDRRVTLLHLTEAGTRELGGATADAEHVATADAEHVAATAVSALDQHEQHTLSTFLARVCVPAGQPQD
jgi:hypothetical protein